MYKYTVSKKVLKLKEELSKITNNDWTAVYWFANALHRVDRPIPFDFWKESKHFTFYSPTRLDRVPFKGYLLHRKLFDEVEI